MPQIVQHLIVVLLRAQKKDQKKTKKKDQGVTQLKIKVPFLQVMLDFWPSGATIPDEVNQSRKHAPSEGEKRAALTRRLRAWRPSKSNKRE